MKKTNRDEVVKKSNNVNIEFASHEEIVAHFERMGRCVANKHEGYDQINCTGYQGGGRDVTMKCSGCGFVYERPATGEEREDYNRIFDLEIGM